MKNEGWMDRVSDVISRIVMFFIAFIVAIIILEVFLRYVAGRPTLWVNEMSLWVAGLVYLLAGLHVMQQRSHIRIAILYDKISRSWQHAFDIISNIFICIFAAAVVWGGFNEALAKLMRWETFGTAWDPPIPATMKPLILVVVVLVAMQSVTNLINDWNKEKKLRNRAENL